MHLDVYVHGSRHIPAGVNGGKPHNPFGVGHLGTPQIGAIVRGRGLLIARGIAAVGHGTTSGLVAVTLRPAAGAALATTLGRGAGWRIALRRIAGRRVARWRRIPTTSATGAAIIGRLGGHFETGVHATGIAMPDFHRGIGHRIIARSHHAALHVLHPNHKLQWQTRAVLGDIAADDPHQNSRDPGFPRASSRSRGPH